MIPTISYSSVSRIVELYCTIIFVSNLPREIFLFVSSIALSSRKSLERFAADPRSVLFKLIESLAPLQHVGL